MNWWFSTNQARPRRRRWAPTYALSGVW